MPMVSYYVQYRNNTAPQKKYLKQKQQQANAITSYCELLGGIRREIRGCCTKVGGVITPLTGCKNSLPVATLPRPCWITGFAQIQSFLVGLGEMEDGIQGLQKLEVALVPLFPPFPSVRPSVTRVDQSKTVEVRIMQFSPYSSSIPLCGVSFIQKF